MLEKISVGERVYVGSASRMGIPHITICKLEDIKEDLVVLSGWLCPRTLSNISENPEVSIVSMERGEGYQFTGMVEEKEIDAVMDGYIPGEEEIPQARYRLFVSISGVMKMVERAHSDREIAYK